MRICVSVQRSVLMNTQGETNNMKEIIDIYESMLQYLQAQQELVDEQLKFMKECLKKYHQLDEVKNDLKEYEKRNS